VPASGRHYNGSMSRLAHASSEALSEGGTLASQLDAFVARPAQLRLTTAIAEAFDQREVLLAEAGTGTGKTLPTWCRRCCRA